MLMKWDSWYANVKFWTYFDSFNIQSVINSNKIGLFPGVPVLLERWDKKLPIRYTNFTVETSVALAPVWYFWIDSDSVAKFREASLHIGRVGERKLVAIVVRVMAIIDVERLTLYQLINKVTVTTSFGYGMQNTSGYESAQCVPTWENSQTWQTKSSIRSVNKPTWSPQTWIYK